MRGQKIPSNSIVTVVRAVIIENIYVYSLYLLIDRRTEEFTMIRNRRAMGESLKHDKSFTKGHQSGIF